MAASDLPRFVISKVDDGGGGARSQEEAEPPAPTDSGTDQRSTDTPVNGNVTFHTSLHDPVRHCGIAVPFATPVCQMKTGWTICGENRVF